MSLDRFLAATVAPAARAPLRTFIDLFAGVGGMRLGLEAAGLRCVFGSEIDAAAAAVYAANFGEPPAGDLTKIDAAVIPPFDVLAGGFPCQAFSVSGRQRGFADARGTLFFEIARILEARRPPAALLENVPNLVKHDGGRTFATIRRVLADVGYDVTWQVLNAADYGVPQQRLRVYVVATRSDLGVTFAFPPPSGPRRTVADIAEPDDATGGCVIDRPDIQLSPDVGGPWAAPHRIGTIGRGGQGERVYAASGPAITLSAYGGGAAARTGAYLINGRVRKLSPREAARCQGFPDAFRLDPRPTQAYKQLGNAVAVPVVAAVARALVAAFAG